MEVSKEKLTALTDRELVNLIKDVCSEVVRRLMKHPEDAYVVSKVSIAESFPADVENGIEEVNLLDCYDDLLKGAGAAIRFSTTKH